MATINNIPIDPSQVTKEWLKTVLKVSMTSVLSFENIGQLRVDVCSKKGPNLDWVAILC